MIHHGTLKCGKCTQFLPAARKTTEHNSELDNAIVSAGPTVSTGTPLHDLA